eukprot:SM000002S05691  [mRNA]  locus=s2:1647785:1657192:+ [translate_table: standard]
MAAGAPAAVRSPTRFSSTAHRLPTAPFSGGHRRNYPPIQLPFVRRGVQDALLRSQWSCGRGSNGAARRQGRVHVFTRIQPVTCKTEAAAALGSHLAAEAAGLAASAPSEEAVVLLEVQGMMCGGCVGAVRSILSSHPFVTSASVNLLTETAAVVLRTAIPVANDGGEELAALLTERGFSSRVRRGLAEGELSAATHRQKVAKRKMATLARSRIQVAGAVVLAAVCCGSHLGHTFHALGWHHIAHGPLFAALDEPWVKCTISLAALLGPARGLVIDGFNALAKNAPGMNTLVGLGACAAFATSFVSLSVPSLEWGASFFEEPTMLLAVVLLGRSLEAQARAEAASDLQALLSLLPATCRMLVDDAGSMEDGAGKRPEDSSELLSPSSALVVPIEQVRQGDCVLVLPGDTIPVDGVVVLGRSAVDESMFTGEAMPVPKEKGMKVLSGTVNWEGAIRVKATATGAKCAVSGIARMVEESQGREAPVQRLADKIAGPFAYAILGLSASTFTFWYYLGTRLFPDVLLNDAAGESGSALLLSLKLAIDVLVVACPCALGLATPTAVLVGTSLGAGRGLLLRGGDALEKLASVDTVTGTLTEGHPSIANIASVGELAGFILKSAPSAELAILQLAAAVEAGTRHPLATAIVNGAAERGLAPLPIRGAITEPGQGAAASLPDIGTVYVGCFDYVNQRAAGQLQGQASASSKAAAELEFALVNRLLTQGTQPEGTSCTIVFVGVEGRGVVGAISLVDCVRTDARRTVDRLHAMGKRVLIMSGDNLVAVQAVASEVGVAAEDVLVNATPQRKAEEIHRLQKAGACVAMVGDGVNDAPALAVADVGVAMRQGGASDAAADAASVILLGNRLYQLVEAMELAHQTFQKILQNLVWAVAYNTVAVPLAAGALLPAFNTALSPAEAGSMMAFSSIAVVSNSLLLRLHSDSLPLSSAEIARQMEGPRGKTASFMAAAAPAAAEELHSLKAKVAQLESELRQAAADAAAAAAAAATVPGAAAGVVPATGCGPGRTSGAHIDRLALYNLLYGTAFIVVGIVAMVFPAIFTVAIEQFIAWLLVIGGIATLLHTFLICGAPGTVAFLLLGLLHLSVGLWLLISPIQGIVSLTFVVAGWFLAYGIFKLVLACSMSNVATWPAVLVSGLLSIVLAFTILGLFPSSSLWVLGLLFGANLTVSGISLLLISLMAYLGEYDPPNPSCPHGAFQYPPPFSMQYSFAFPSEPAAPLTSAADRLVRYLLCLQSSGLESKHDNARHCDAAKRGQEQAREPLVAPGSVGNHQRPCLQICRQGKGVGVGKTAMVIYDQ